jgi:hypothetical protein
MPITATAGLDLTKTANDLRAMLDAMSGDPSHVAVDVVQGADHSVAPTIRVDLTGMDPEAARETMAYVGVPGPISPGPRTVGPEHALLSYDGPMPTWQTSLNKVADRISHVPGVAGAETVRTADTGLAIKIHPWRAADQARLDTYFGARGLNQLYVAPPVN